MPWPGSRSRRHGCARSSTCAWRWRRVVDATCAGCGCACDDIEVTIVEGRLAGLTRTCPLGDQWFAERAGDRPPVACIAGRTVSFEEATGAATRILREAQAPLVY